MDARACICWHLLRQCSHAYVTQSACDVQIISRAKVESKILNRAGMALSTTAPDAECKSLTKDKANILSEKRLADTTHLALLKGHYLFYI